MVQHRRGQSHSALAGSQATTAELDRSPIDCSDATRLPMSEPRAFNSPTHARSFGELTTTSWISWSTPPSATCARPATWSVTPHSHAVTHRRRRVGGDKRRQRPARVVLTDTMEELRRTLPGAQAGRHRAGTSEQDNAEFTRLRAALFGSRRDDDARVGRGASLHPVRRASGQTDRGFGSASSHCSTHRSLLTCSSPAR